MLQEVIGTRRSDRDYVERRAGKPRDDRELINLCKRTRKLFIRKREIEQRLFAAIEGDRLELKLRQVARAAVARLQTAVAKVAATPASSSEGLAYKAALLAPWIAAGFMLDDDYAPGRELALTIAEDAREIGTRDLRSPQRARKH